MILVAPDTFKGSLPASTVAGIVADALRAADPGRTVTELPLADGGEGTVDRAIEAGFEPELVGVTGPLGDPIQARFARSGDVVVIEMAAAAGLSTLPTGPDAHSATAASTFGVGELIGHAADLGAGRIIVGLGGSATTDGGTGLAEALGVTIRTRDGDRIGRGAGSLIDVGQIDLGPMIERLRDIDVVLATDVTNSLTGPLGAARVYGAQKGADAGTVRRLDIGLAHWADVLAAATGVDARRWPGAGAGGGTAMPLLAARCARIESGIDVVMELIDFERHARGAELVVVGEGSLDRQSLQGKGPVGAARRSRSAGTRVVAIVGQNRLTPDELADAAIDRVYAMTDIEPDPRVCIREPEPILRRLAVRIAAAEIDGRP